MYVLLLESLSFLIGVDIVDINWFVTIDLLCKLFSAFSSVQIGDIKGVDLLTGLSTSPMKFQLEFPNSEMSLHEREHF